MCEKLTLVQSSIGHWMQLTTNNMDTTPISFSDKKSIFLPLSNEYHKIS